MGTPSFHLERFVEAQATVYTQALAELQAGQKRSHWMWFIFPQIAGLGSSETAQRFAISGRDEAVAYLRHQTLGPRLRICTEAVNQLSGLTVDQIFGYPDNLKFHSSISLFNAAEPGEASFRAALDKYFAGQLDHSTVALL
jgi:uncharacterized protein (DUF1810 family)